MKGALLFIAIFALSMLIIPMIALNYQTVPPSAPAPVILSPPTSAPVPEREFPADAPYQPLPPMGPPDRPLDIDAPFPSSIPPLSGIPAVSHFRILDETTGAIHTVPLRDYVVGAVAAEMPASFHPEALKAQAVAAHTFALHQHLVQQRIPNPQLRGADFSADPSNRWGFVTEEVARQIFGYREDEHWEAVTAAVDSVLHLILKFEGEPIVAAYHAISAGRTEYASNVWVGSAPYLVPAYSGGCLHAPGFETQETFTAEQLRTALQAAYPQITLTGDPSGWLEVTQRSSSGYVTTIRVGDTVLRGIDVRRALSLRSHHFEFALSGGEFTFTVLGYGHGVGLSQRGAEYMARAGATFEQILLNYYTGASLYQITIDS